MTNNLPPLWGEVIDHARSSRLISFMHPRRYSPSSSRLRLSQRLPGSSSAALPSSCLSPAKAEGEEWRRRATQRSRIPGCPRPRPPQRRRTRPKRSPGVAVAPKRAPVAARPRRCNCGGVGAAASLKNERERSTRGIPRGVPPPTPTTTNAPIGGEPRAEVVAPAAAAAAGS